MKVRVLDREGKLLKGYYIYKNFGRYIFQGDLDDLVNSIKTVYLRNESNKRRKDNILNSVLNDIFTGIVVCSIGHNDDEIRTDIFTRDKHSVKNYKYLGNNERDIVSLESKSTILNLDYKDSSTACIKMYLSLRNVIFKLNDFVIGDPILSFRIERDTGIPNCKFENVTIVMDLIDR